MSWLRDTVATITYARDRASLLYLLLAKLKELDIPVRRQNSSQVVASCLTLRELGVPLWRCWSDTLEFELHDAEGGHTALKVCVVPNLFRTGTRPGEAPYELSKLIGVLRAL